MFPKEEVEARYYGPEVKNERGVPTFKEPFVRSSFDKKVAAIIERKVKLYEFETNKRFVIRRGDPTWMLDAGQFTSSETACLTVKGLFAELWSKYSIRTPVHFVVTRDESGKAVFYILTERVQATPLDAQGRNKIKGLFEKLLQYYEDKSRSGELFMPDLPYLHQYEYGVLPDVLEPDWYLIDTDPLFTSDKDAMWSNLGEVPDELEDLQTKFGIDFSHLQKGFEELANRVSAESEPP